MAKDFILSLKLSAAWCTTMLNALIPTFAKKLIQAEKINIAMMQPGKDDDVEKRHFGIRPPANASPVTGLDTSHCQTTASLPCF